MDVPTGPTCPSESVDPWERGSDTRSVQKELKKNNEKEKEEKEQEEAMREKEEWQVLEGKKTDESLCECIEKKNGSLEKLFFFPYTSRQQQ